MQTLERLLILVFWVPIALIYSLYDYVNESKIRDRWWYNHIPLVILASSSVPVFLLIKTLLITPFTDIFESIQQEQNSDDETTKKPQIVKPQPLKQTFSTLNHVPQPQKQKTESLLLKFLTQASGEKPTTASLQVKSDKKVEAIDLVAQWESNYMGTYISDLNKKSYPSVQADKLEALTVRKISPQASQSVEEWEAQYFGQYEKTVHKKEEPPKVEEGNIQQNLQDRIIKEQQELLEWSNGRKIRERLDLSLIESSMNAGKRSSPKEFTTEVDAKLELSTVKLDGNIDFKTENEGKLYTNEFRMDQSFRSQSSSFQLPTLQPARTMSFQNQEQFLLQQAIQTPREPINVLEKSDIIELREFQRCLIEKIDQKFEELQKKKIQRQNDSRQDESCRLTPRSKLSEQDKEELKEFERSLLEKIDKRLEEFKQISTPTPEVTKRFFVSANKERSIVPRLQLDNVQPQQLYFGRPNFDISAIRAAPSCNTTDREQLLNQPQTARSESQQRIDPQEFLMKIQKKQGKKKASQTSTAINTPSRQASVDRKREEADQQEQKSEIIQPQMEAKKPKKKFYGAPKWKPKA